MYYYVISLPPLSNREKFAAFMRDEYFPAVHRGATRLGQLKGMVLLQSRRAQSPQGLDFVWQIDWNGLPLGSPAIDNPDTVREFEKFKPVVTQLGDFEEAATLTNSSAL